MAVIKQKAAFLSGRYRVAGQPRTFTREELGEYVNGTKAAMAAGIAIPALKKHAPPGADDHVTAQFSATDGAGWLKGIEQDADGALEFELDVPDDIKAEIDAGKIKFTSPEFRPSFIDGKGRSFGKVVRHIAFTPFPRNPDQGKLESIAMSDCVQCSDDDYEGPEEKGDDKDKGDGDKPPPKTNPDLPADPDAKSKGEALVACFSTMGMELPAGFDFSGLGDKIDVLLTAAKTASKAKQEADTAKKEPEEPELKESNAMPFSEQDIAGLPVAMQAKARKANEDAKARAAEALQFAEERATAKRKDATAAIKATKLPPGLKKKILDQVGAVQFSEKGESPTLTLEAAAKLFSESMPDGLQFEDADLSESEHPDGDKFFDGAAETPEQAEATARRIHSRNKSPAAK